VPPGIKAALNRLAEATVDGDRASIRGVLDAVMAVTANELDQGTRLELVRLAQAIAE
jgi:hypothetical protein